MLKAFVQANLWDIVDGGIDATLDRIQSLGATGLSLQVTGGPIAQLRALPHLERRVFRSRGGYFFHPAEEHYRDTHLQPIAATWLTRRNPLENVTTACRARDLVLRLRISALEVGRIAARHPEVAGATVFGDAAPVTLCPANPEVRALLRGTVVDLAQNHAPAAIELTDVRYHSGALSGAGLDLGVDAGPTLLSLLGICFSPSSRQSATEHGVEAAAAARSTRLRIEKALRTGHDVQESMAELLAEDEILAAYVEHQRFILKDWMTSLRAAVSTLVLIVVPANHAAATPPFAESPPADNILFADLHEKADDGATGSSPPEALEFEPGDDLVAQPQQFVSALSEAARRGVRTILPRSFALWPVDQDEVIRQAIRFARRNTP